MEHDDPIHNMIFFYMADSINEEPTMKSKR